MQAPNNPPVRHLVADGESRRSRLRKRAFALPRLVFKLWFVLVFSLSMLVLYLPFRLLLRTPAGYPAAFRLMRRWGWFLGVAGMVPLRRMGETRMPGPPYVACFNHTSYLDIVHAFCLLPDYFVFMGKHELLDWPLFNVFFRGMHIAVNRGNGAEAARALLKAGQAIGQGHSVGIFPEGTISLHAPRMMPFKEGAFRLAIKKQVPIVPVTFLDNWRLFGDPQELWSRGRPGIARAVVHPPVETKGLRPEDADDLRLRVFEIIEAPLRIAWPQP